MLAFHLAYYYLFTLPLSGTHGVRVYERSTTAALSKCESKFYEFLTTRR
jgi:hypothetical protein